MSSHEDDEEARTCAVQLQELKSTVRLNRARQSVIDRPAQRCVGGAECLNCSLSELYVSQLLNWQLC